MATLTVTSATDSGSGSLREAIALAQPNDTIVFDPSLANGTIALNTQLEVNKNLTIDGTNAPNLTISGGNTTRIFDIVADRNFNPPTVAFRNLILANGRTMEMGLEGSGGAIRTSTEATIVVDTVAFNNNTVTGDGGGAIFTGVRHNTTIVNSTFSGNDATPGNSERGGGAIATSSEGNLVVRNSVFSDNRGINGGAIHSLLGGLTVENSTFLNNTTTAGAVGTGTIGYGGAIYTDGASATTDASTSGTISIQNSRFENNNGAGQGGGLFLFAYNGDTVEIDRASITNNTIIPDGRGDALGGGLRIGGGGIVSIANSTVANNQAQVQGGGLWIGESTPLTIVNSTFSGNRAESPDGSSGLGGAMLLASSSTVSITNTTIANNIAGFQGGGFWGGGSNVTLTNSIVAFNQGVNGFNVNHQTGFQFSDGGGNIQSPDPNPNDTQVTSTVTLVDPAIGPLQDNGGGLQTHALLSGSPAIDAGVNVSGVTTDQRGGSRTDGQVDIGAFEFGATVNPTPLPAPADPIFIELTSGDDSLVSGSDPDAILALEGNDTLFGGSGNDTLSGNAGNDIIVGNEDMDFLLGGQGEDLIFANKQNDVLMGDLGNDTLFGGMNEDVLFGNGNGDFLSGDLGNDSLFGGQGDDTLLGSDGDDFLSGDRGSDLLVGGAGGDRFVLASGQDPDVILDFEDGLDSLILTGELSFDRLTIAPIENGVTIGITETGEILVLVGGVETSTISVDDFAIA